jgi:hypothetical protein
VAGNSRERGRWADIQPRDGFGDLLGGAGTWPLVGPAWSGDIGHGALDFDAWTFVMSWYREYMPKQTTVRLPDDLADQAEAVARVRGTSVNALIVDSLAAEIEKVRADEDFTARARKLLERDKELLDRLAR